jgi:hypothetical protein
MYPGKTAGVVCLITALAMLVGCEQPQQSVDASATSAEPLKIAVEPAATPPPAAKKPVAKSAATKPATAKAPATKSATSGTVADTATPNAPVTESRSVAMKQDEEAILTTVSGCLEEDDGQFRLKDAEGDDAPKSRSWKSGFIKKGAAKIDVFDAGNRFNLMSRVGYRVTVSGSLVDREMHARSVRATAERCD